MFGKILSLIILRITNLLIWLKYGSYTNSEIIDTHITNAKVNGIHGYSKMAAIHLKSSADMYIVQTKGGKVLQAADEHIVYIKGRLSESGIPTPLMNLTKGDILIAKDGFDEVEKISKVPRIFTFDMSVTNPTNSYWSDGIMSHNSITSAIFIVWYILSNSDKNVVCLSQNEDKVTDLMEKIKTIIKNLPYHLKPGIIKWDVSNVHFDNGCKIKAQTTTPNSAAGITADVLYMDEFALVNKTFIREFYRTAYPTISAMPNAKIIITSTPRGLNKFWEIYDKALRGLNHYNPLRIDWWEVPGRDDVWKQQEIANIGSLEDFNQEYGNQFLAGNTMLLPEPELKRVKMFETEFVGHDIPELDDYNLEYKDGNGNYILKWHPMFNMDELDNKEAYFVIVIDLGGGEGNDYSVANIKQILPMTIDEMNKVEYFTDEKDFFKLVQVGMLRTNVMKVPKFADFCYKMLTSLFIPDNFKIILEVNHAGNEFITQFTTVFGPRNIIDEDQHFIKYKHRITDKNPKTGIKINEENKKSLCSKIKDKIKYNQLVICEKTTTQEMLNFTRNENGTYSATSGHDDCIMTEVLATSIFDTEDFYEFIEEMLPNMPESFLAEIDKIVANSSRVTLNEDEDEDEFSEILG